MVVNKGNGVYEVKISLDEGDFDLASNKSVVGDFTVEVFEKNFGTIKEDVQLRENISVEDLFIDNKKVSWETLNHLSKVKIANFIVELSIEELRKFQYGS